MTKRMKVTDKYVFFWGSIFSNFYPCSIIVDDIEFTSSEQCFMYYKAKYFKDEEIANKILFTNNPARAKRLGRKVKNFNSDEWMKVCKTYMKRACKAKFQQNEDLKKKMMSFKDKIFVEASPIDNIWGVGLGENDKLILDEKNWKGRNFLGEVLTEIKNELILEENV